MCHPARRFRFPEQRHLYFAASLPILLPFPTPEARLQQLSRCAFSNLFAHSHHDSFHIKSSPSSDTAQSRQMCLCGVASAIQKDGAVPKSPVLCGYTAFAKRSALVLLKLLEEGEVILTLFVGESDRRPGMLVQVAGQQVLDVIAPYHAVVFQLLHLIL